MTFHWLLQHLKPWRSTTLAKALWRRGCKAKLPEARAERHLNFLSLDLISFTLFDQVSHIISSYVYR
jgi:hypothetical protein